MNNTPLHDLQPATLQEKSPSQAIQLLFSQLNPGDVEQFTHAYHTWTLHQQMAQLSLQISLIHQEIDANKEQLHLFQPTTLALSTLAQLQAHGVHNIDLLDRLHTRGETWLDQALQLLEHCERLDLIQGDYTQWCEHALEGAYDWLSSIDEEDLSNAENGIELVTSIHTEETDTPNNTLVNETKALLLRKLFTDTDTSAAEKATEVSIPSQVPPGEEPEVEETHAEDTTPKIENLTEEIPVSPLTLDQQELIIEPSSQEQTHISETPDDTLDDKLTSEEEIAEHKENFTMPEISHLEDSQTPAQEEKEQDSQQVKEQPEAEVSEDSASHETSATSNEADYHEGADTPDTIVQDEAIIIIANEQSNGPNSKEKQGPTRPAKRHGIIRRLIGHFFPKG